MAQLGVNGAIALLEQVKDFMVHQQMRIEKLEKDKESLRKTLLKKVGFDVKVTDVSVISPESEANND